MAGRPFVYLSSPANWVSPSGSFHIRLTGRELNMWRRQPTTDDTEPLPRFHTGTGSAISHWQQSHSHTPCDSTAPSTSTLQPTLSSWPVTLRVLLMQLGTMLLWFQAFQAALREHLHGQVDPCKPCPGPSAVATAATSSGLRLGSARGKCQGQAPQSCMGCRAEIMPSA